MEFNQFRAKVIAWHELDQQVDMPGICIGQAGIATRIACGAYDSELKNACCSGLSVEDAARLVADIDDTGRPGI